MSTIYCQVDGGAVNTARVMIGLAELNVAKGVVRKLIIITKLPVGHTHEDIDSKFAKIWVMLRRQHVATMGAYKDLLIKASSGTGNQLCEVIDIFVAPDYFLCWDLQWIPNLGVTLSCNEPNCSGDLKRLISVEHFH